MSSLSQFTGGSGLMPTSIVRGPSSRIPGLINYAGDITQAVRVLSGACTANTLKTILSISGRGAIGFLGANATDSTSRSNRIKITRDGIVIYDTTESAAASQMFMQVIGSTSKAASEGFIGLIENIMYFNTSLLIEYATSLTETDKCQFAYTYYLR